MALGRALTARPGFRAHIATDEDLESLRGTPEFEALLAGQAT
jgi:hypothetical protein